MTQSTPLRKLAAIMFTDIAGYTAAMSADEESALKTLRKKRSILKPLIIDNNGTFVKEIGDGTLSYFRSAIDAATCAVKLQQATYDDADMNLRIGVHVGDIVFDDEDVFGDGVNVAARLESMAPVGGVCVSKSVFEELLNKKEFDGIPLGLQQLKGVGRLIDVFALKAKNLIHPDPKEYEEHKVEPHSDEEVPSVAVLPLKNKGKEDDAFYAYGITADLFTGLSSAGRIRVASMDDVETIESAKLSSEEIAKKLRVRYIVSGMLWKHEDMFQLSVEMNDTKNNTVVWSDRWQEPWEELTTIKSKLSESLLSVLNIGILDTTAAIQTNTEAYEYYLKAKFKYAKRQNIEDTEIARGLFQKAIDLDNTLLQAKIGIGVSYHETGDYDKAKGLYEKVLNQAKELSDKQEIGHSLNNIGKIYYEKGDYDKALDFYTRSRELFEELGDKRGVGILLDDIGKIYREKGDYDNALHYCSCSLEIKKELDDKQGIGASLVNSGIIYKKKGDHDKAIDYYFKSFELCKELGNKRGIGASLINIGNIYLSKGEYIEALDHYTHSFEIFEDLGDKRAKAASLDNIGIIYYMNGDYDNALDFYFRSLAIKEEVGDQLGIGNSLNNIGAIHNEQGDDDEALVYFTRSLEIREVLGDRRGIAGALNNIGSIYNGKCNYDKSLEYLEKSLTIQQELGLRFLETTTFLFLSYKQIGKKYDPKEIQTLIKEADNIEYDLNFRLFELLGDKSHLDTAYKQVLGKANGLEDSEKFLNYPIPKAIVEMWESIEK
ncbi:MAG: tetratricopeptide repeat protein [Candidatus Marinimicrobia bacterium]|nr:tetratricopeptide repeat protein [Candidatus Neomarinimicrobiota bacterium]